jgi:hypothetical protein
MYSCKSITILNEIISLCRTQQELNTLNISINQSSFVLKAKKTDKRILYLSAGKLETSFTEFINYGIRGHLKPRAAT